MTGIKQVGIVLFSLMVLIVASGVNAQQASSIALGGYETVDVLDHIDFAARQAIIGGHLYNLAADMKWYGLEPESRPEGQRDRFYKKPVGYALRWDNGSPVIAAIWILSY